MSKKTQEILDKMTLERKVAQIMQLPHVYITEEAADVWIKRGIGSFLHVFTKELCAEIQNRNTEVGNEVPIIFGIDAIHGHCLNLDATVFPTQLGQACSWNAELVEKAAHVTAKEVSSCGIQWTFSPVLCLGRDLRWGRVGETYGEDKYLSGRLGAAAIRGYQGTDEKLGDDRIVACAKHFIGYGEATGGRDSYDTEITERKMREEFLPPFEEAVKAGCKSFMTAYGSLDGTPCTANSRLLRDVLKKELGFDGFVVTDWANVQHLVSTQFCYEDIRDAAKVSLESGNDMMMNAEAFYEACIDLVKKGEIDEKLLDEAVLRVLDVKEKLGLFDNPLRRYEDEPMHCASHLAVSRELAEDSVVLLKNNGILPLDVSKKVAVVGRNADDVRAYFGDWSCFTHPSPRFDAKPSKPYYTLVGGLEEIGVDYKYVDVGDSFATECDCEKVIRELEGYDTVLFAFGDNIYENGEGKDRADLSLDEVDLRLFNALKSDGKEIISVYVASKPLCVYDVAKDSRAFLTGFNGGAYGGLALAEVIFGKIEPSGKLPISFPYAGGHVQCYYNLLRGSHNARYVDLPDGGNPFAFGEGLSYTSFDLSQVEFDKESMKLSVSVANVGDRLGKTVIQVYVKDCYSSIVTPEKRLIAYRKVSLGVGEETDIAFDISLKDLSFVAPDLRRVVEAGEFELLVGTSSKIEDLVSVKLRIPKTIKL